ncbi:MAG: Arginine deiminase [Streblomastix strix]|uniref:Arginine deiminase n=1 Tax=Streblomastix strix TaxID=222440 RepID=A0A5J4WVJ1_9EUKA|nr:MAG: Arginine deiminase [Streblomastix strix]
MSRLTKTLQQLAQKSIQYKLDIEIKANELREEDNLMLQSNFKGDEEKIESSTAKMKPFINMTLCKDQQITTRKGVVIGSMQKKQREIESQIMEFVLKKLNIPVIHRLPKVDGQDRLCLEGGYFLPAGDHCFIGCGLRTNKKAIEYMLKHDLFGTENAVVVEDSTWIQSSISPMKKGRVVCTHEDTARLLVNEEKFKGQIYLISFDEIIAMNGVSTVPPSQSATAYIYLHISIQQCTDLSIITNVATIMHSITVSKYLKVALKLIGI